MIRATLTTPSGRTEIVTLSDSIDEIEILSTPAFVIENTNKWIQAGKVKRIVATKEEVHFWTDDGESILKSI